MSVPCLFPHCKQISDSCLAPHLDCDLRNAPESIKLSMANYLKLTGAEIEEIERTFFPHLFEICHLDVRPKPPLLQALWANCKDL